MRRSRSAVDGLVHTGAPVESGISRGHRSRGKVCAEVDGFGTCKSRGGGQCADQRRRDGGERATNFHGDPIPKKVVEGGPKTGCSRIQTGRTHVYSQRTLMSRNLAVCHDSWSM